MNKSRTNILALLEHIHPLDDLERQTIVRTSEWIQSGASLYRGEQPDLPDPHLVVYFVLVDFTTDTLLLVDHIKAGLWLPTGGHVELGESPAETVRRELAEELGLTMRNGIEIATAPLFVTLTLTQGNHQHTDVTLWYVVSASQNVDVTFDTREFKHVRWADYNDILLTDSGDFDPHMQRFITKLQGSLID